MIRILRENRKFFVEDLLKDQRKRNQQKFLLGKLYLSIENWLGRYKMSGNLFFLKMQKTSIGTVGFLKNVKVAEIISRFSTVNLLFLSLFLW